MGPWPAGMKALDYVSIEPGSGIRGVPRAARTEQARGRSTPIRVSLGQRDVDVLFDV